MIEIGHSCLAITLIICLKENVYKIRFFCLEKLKKTSVSLILSVPIRGVSLHVLETTDSDL